MALKRYRFTFEIDLPDVMPYEQPHHEALAVDVSYLATRYAEAVGVPNISEHITPGSTVHTETNRMVNVDSEEIKRDHQV